MADNFTSSPPWERARPLSSVSQPVPPRARNPTEKLSETGWVEQGPALWALRKAHQLLLCQVNIVVNPRFSGKTHDGFFSFRRGRLLICVGGRKGALRSPQSHLFSLFDLVFMGEQCTVPC